MAKSKGKGIVLGLTLIVPLGVVLFLYMFGENKFALPVFYPEGVKATVENPPDKREYETELFYREEGTNTDWLAACDYPAGEQHTVAGISFKTIEGYDYNPVDMKSPYVVAFLPEEDGVGDYGFVLSELMRIRNEYDFQEMQILLVFADSSLDQREWLTTSQLAGWQGVIGYPQQVAEWANCQLVIPHALGKSLSVDEPYTNILTLIDAKHRIRGYFDGALQTETDRLNVELRVLLQEEN